MFVPPLSQLSYRNLNILSDICLETIEWSGCNSTFDAIAGYVEIAARLALDPQWRECFVRNLVAGSPKVYSDKRRVLDFEDFSEQVVRERLR